MLGFPPFFKFRIMILYDVPSAIWVSDSLDPAGCMTVELSGADRTWRASINTATPEGKLVFGIFAALSEFERELISERENAT
jgi:hypothetical protein